MIATGLRQNNSDRLDFLLVISMLPEGNHMHCCSLEAMLESKTFLLLGLDSSFFFCIRKQEQGQTSSFFMCWSSCIGTI